MSTDSGTEVHEAGRIAALWTGLLLAPAAFLLNLEFAYVVTEWGCKQASMPPATVHLVHAACLLLVCIGGLIAWRQWRSDGARWPGEAGGPEGRSRFMSGLGLATSAFFGLVILAQWIPSISLHTCR
jgi:hypothetical protein